jgi:hypothetical protein
MKPHLCLYFFILLFLFSIKKLYSKTPLDFNLIAGTNEVSVGKILSITQDKWGYVWFCDQSSVCLIRYDGSMMKIYRNDPKDSNSIDPSNFECFATDSSGNIWLPVNEGVDKLDPLTGISTHYRFNKNSPFKSVYSNIFFDHLTFGWVPMRDLTSWIKKPGNLSITNIRIMIPHR